VLASSETSVLVAVITFVGSPEGSPVGISSVGFTVISYVGATVGLFVMAMVSSSVGLAEGDSDSAMVGAAVISTGVFVDSPTVGLTDGDSELTMVAVYVGEAEAKEASTSMGASEADPDSATVGGNEEISVVGYLVGANGAVSLSLESACGTHSNKGSPRGFPHKQNLAKQQNPIEALQSLDVSHTSK
jgi:hypothetical protein